MWAALQAPLLQDGGAVVNHATHDSTALTLRFLQINLAADTTRQLVYLVDQPGNEVSEAVAVNDHELLVDERDGGSGTHAHFKKLMLADTTGASDVSDVPSLITHGAAPGVLHHGVRPMTKRVFMDLIASTALGKPIIGYDRWQALMTDKKPLDRVPEKFEGLCFGPDLPDGRHTLLVTTDNDFRPHHPTWVFVFAIDRADLPGFVPEHFAQHVAFAADTAR